MFVTVAQLTIFFFSHYPGTYSKRTDILSKVCVDVISQAVEGEYALCLTANSGYFDEYIAVCSNSINIPILTILPEDFRNNLNNRRIPTGCNAYVTFSDNFTYLERLFDYKQDEKFQFETHKRIIVVYSAVRNFLTPPFSDVASIKGNDVIVIDSFNTTMTQKELLMKMRITSVLQNKTSFISSHAQEGMFNITGMLRLKSWKPNFRDGNRSFRIATFNCTPFIYTNLENQVYDGIDFHLVQLLLRGWPITFVAYETIPYMNMYNLILQTVHYELNDLGTCSIWQTAVLFADLDYTHSYTESCSSFLVPKPRETTRIWFVYRPIKLWTWFCIGVAVIITGIFLNFAYKIYGKTRENSSYYFLLTLRILSLGPIERIVNERHKILRAILLIWILICLILTTAYSAGFSSILTRPKLKHLSTIKDMVEDKIKWGSTSAFVKSDVISSIYPDALELARNFLLEKDNFVKNRRIRSNKYAIVSDRLMEYYVTNTEYLDQYGRTYLEVLPQCYLKNAFIYPLSPNSPYKQLLNRRVFELSEYGFVRYWTNRIIIKYNMFYMYRFFEINNGIGNHIPLSMAKIQGIFYFLLMGYILSLIVFVFELHGGRPFFV
ncbi:hypothetical protein Trydic_g12080 [Trypoxylus dichotomus]